MEAPPGGGGGARGAPSRTCQLGSILETIPKTKWQTGPLRSKIATSPMPTQAGGKTSPDKTFKGKDTAPRAPCPRSLWGLWRDDGSRTFRISPHRPPRPTPQQLRGPPGIVWVHQPPRAVPRPGPIWRWQQEPTSAGSPLERRADFWGEGWREGREGFEAPAGHAPLRRALQRLPGRRKVRAGRTAGPPRGPGRAAAGGGRPAGPRSALPAATLAGAKGRRQASQRTRLRRGQRAGAMAAPGAAGEPRGRGCLRCCGRCSGRAARAMRGGAGAALARPRLATLCRCAPPPPTARRADPGPRQPRRAPSPRPSFPSPHPSFPHEPPPP